jgi:mannitol-1-phosphate/altronate dehydrogenase
LNYVNQPTLSLTELAYTQISTIGLAPNGVLLKKNLFLANRAVMNPALPSPSLQTVSELWNQKSRYNRQSLNTQIVHFGPGRFFRGHLARIVHQYLAQREPQEQRWGICGVSLKSRETIANLQPQDYLYTLVERHCSTETHESAEIVGSINQIVDGTQEQEYVLELMASPSVQLVTLTVTQAGYCIDSGFNLDVTQPSIAHDLTNPDRPTTVIGFLVEALRRRRDRAIAPFTTLSCDNLPRNGEILQKAVLAYADLLDPEMADYLSTEATFPNTVVDRIVPQAHESDLDYPRHLLQVSDRTPIVTEPFWQFVVEDKFKGERPTWEDVGVTMTDDITPYLYLKSRFLNAMHSFIACLAVRAGIDYVHETVKLREFYWFIELLMDDIAAATPVPYFMCKQYQKQVLSRFSNEALPDKIDRISAETARKVGKYIVPIIQDAHARNISRKRLILPIAAWVLAVREGTESGQPYCPQDKDRVLSDLKAKVPLSRSIGLSQSIWTKDLDRECDRAIREIQHYGLVATVIHSCKDYHEISAAA